MDETTTRCPGARWCTEGDHAVTPHKQLLGQWFTEAVNGRRRGVTLQLELWAKFDRPEIVRMAVSMVDSGSLLQMDCELTADQATNLAASLTYGVGVMSA